jgi:hypothetical protein
VRPLGAPFGSRNDHVDRPAAAAGTDEPVAPIKHRRFGAVAFGELTGVGLDLMLAITAPDDEPDAGRRQRSRASSEGRGRISTACPVAALRRRFIALQRRQGLANGLGSELGEDRA